eukprot:6784829-Karenia_brevis.AAC.1
MVMMMMMMMMMGRILQECGRAPRPRILRFRMPRLPTLIRPLGAAGAIRPDTGGRRSAAPPRPPNS